MRAKRVTSRPTLAWEQVGLARAARDGRRAADVDRAAAARRRADASSSGCSSRRRTGSSRTARVGARAWQRGSDIVTLALWRRSLGRAARRPHRLAGDRRRGPDVAAARPLYPGLDERFSPGLGARRRPCCTSARTTRATTRATAARRGRARAGERLVVVGGYAGPADGARARRARHRRRAGRALPPRRRVRRHEPLRGLRLPGARGDGVRHAGRRVRHDVDPRARRRRRAALPAAATWTRSPRRCVGCAPRTDWRTICAVADSRAPPSSRGSAPRGELADALEEAARS